MTGPCLLLLALLAATPEQTPLTLEIRAFNGTEDVTAETRVTVHKAGDRGNPVGRTHVGEAQSFIQVLPGIYDAQAVQEKRGRVVNIRWAERLVVMPYPDEAGHHLQVINFAAGYGALQVRRLSGDLTAGVLALFPSGERSQPAPSAHAGPHYVLFVVPAGRYDILIKDTPEGTWHTGIEVPLDRTRLWVVP
ncbi:hypothetical protein BH24ACI4_BH24ACI4_20250 [soil metagenome]|jgi:hypothetical protein